MSVYVDRMSAPFRRMRMCHMLADTHEELIVMADRLGVDSKWIQKAGTPEEHFDICLSKRKLALAAGAIEISTRDMVALIQARRKLTAAT
jgi:hypothetical protein